MNIHHLNCGTLCPPAARRAVGSDRLVCHVLLVETERSGLVLVDTGIGTAEVESPGRLPRLASWLLGPRLSRAETAVEQVRALGFAPRDVRHVVVTHLDLDHAGGLADFPEAEVHLHADEHRAATAGPTLGERLRYLRCQLDHGPRWQPYGEVGDRWYGFRAVRALRGLPEDIALVPLLGHSRGHSGVAVRCEGRWLLHAGDAYMHRAELEPSPRCPPGLRLVQRLDDFASDARLVNQERLRELRERHAEEVDVFCSHDPVELERLARRAPSSSRYATEPAGIA